MTTPELPQYPIKPLYVDDNGDAWFWIQCPGCKVEGKQKGYNPDPCFCYDCAEEMFGLDLPDFPERS